MMHLAPSRKGGAKHGIKSAGRECGACRGWRDTRSRDPYRGRRAAPEQSRMPVPEPIAAAADADAVAIDVVIPALDEERSLPLVLAGLPRPPVRRVVVADNGSADSTARGGAPGRAVVVAAPPRA